MGRPKLPDNTMGHDLSLAGPYLDGVDVMAGETDGIDNLDLHQVAECKWIDARCECEIGTCLEKRSCGRDLWSPKPKPMLPQGDENLGRLNKGIVRRDNLHIEFPDTRLRCKK